MARTRELNIKITGDASSALRALKSVDSTTRTTGSRIGSAFKNMGRFALAGIGGLVAGAALLGKTALDAAQEAAQVGAQTKAVLTSTKGAANVTAKEIDKLAGSIMGYSAIGDEAIKSGQNLLLTFTGIRNEVGQGNDIFNQATETMVDMSVALGQDLKSSAIQLGKSLNDPVRGMTALRRVGVSFTAKQEALIKKLVDSGKTMEAQKVILRELRKEFGGSARAVGNTKPWDKFKNAVGEVVEGIGKALLPTINALAKRLIRFVNSDEFQAWIKRAAAWLRNNLPKAIDATARFFRQELIPALQKAGVWFGRVISWIEGLVNWIQNLIDAVRTANNELSKLGEIGDSVRSQLRGAAEGLPGIGPLIRVFPKQHGGPVSASGSYLVGERGPELFSPGTSGRITPNNRLRGAGGGVTINIYGDAYDGIEDRIAQVISDMQSQGVPA